jgi:ABC-type branched-subunit amino acid transport system substrate-binding protein
MRRRLAVALACALWASAGVGAEDAPSPERAYAEALRIAAEDPAAGSELLAAFLKQHSKHPLADDAGLRLAELHDTAGRSREATRVLERVVALAPGDQTTRAQFRLAEHQRARGSLADAYETARTLRFAELSAPERKRAHRLLADLARERGERVETLRWLGQLRGDARSSAEVAAADQELDAAIAELSDAQLVASARQLGAQVPAARLWLRGAERALARGDRAAAEAALTEARRAPLAGADAAALARLAQQVAGDRGAQDLLEMQARAGDAAPLDATRAVGTLGVALPLSGDFATYAEESLQGALVAAGFFGAAPPGITLEVRDTGGTAAGALAAIEALAADPAVLGVIGPLAGDEADAAAAAADAAGLPLLALSRREGLDVGRSSVFPLALSPRIEAELVAEYATATLGLRRFALLYPDDAYGLAVRAAFWDAIEARGGEVVSVVRYAPTTQDFSRTIRRLVGYDFLSPGVLAALSEREAMRKRAKRLVPREATELNAAAAALTAPDGSPLPPYVDFEALFIPDASQNVGLIAPHLAFQGVLGVRLLGTSGWHHPDLLRLAGQHLDGAIFPSGFFAGSAQPALATFQASYQRAFQRTPSYLAAQAHDALLLLARELAAGASTREAVLAQLRAGLLLPGASGVIAIERGGQVTKRPHLLGVERGAFMSVDETGGAPALRVRGAPQAPAAAP